MYESSPTETNQKKDEKEQIMKKIRQLENQQKILLNRQSDMERRARTRRLIEHGAILESVLSNSYIFCLSCPAITFLVLSVSSCLFISSFTYSLYAFSDGTRPDEV